MKKQPLIKTLLLITIISIGVFADVSFADDNTADQTLEIVTLAINFFLSFSSRIWIIFANLAGEFLSNARVYGSVIGMDSFLWLCRNLMRNLANFALGAIFVFYLFRALFFQEEVAAILKNIILKLIVAGIAIQASWFLIAAILDISTIATSAVGSIPAQLISSNANFAEGMVGKTEIGQIISEARAQGGKITKRIDINLLPTDGNKRINTELTTVETNLTEDNIYDLLLPNANSLAGPLVFLGANILNTQNVDSVSIVQNKLAASLTKVIIDAGGTIIYSVAMILLTIIAFMRILYLRAFIILSPILLLLFCLKTVGSEKVKGIESISNGLEKSGLSIKTFLNLAFKPVIITAGISLALMFSILMQITITKNEQSSFEISPGVSISSTDVPSTSEQGNQEKNISLSSATLSITIKNIGKTFGELILTVLTLVFMWIIIKATITNKIGIESIDNFGKSATGLFEKVAGSASIIPVGSGTISYNSLFGEGGLKNKIEGSLREKTAALESGNIEKIDKLLGKEETLDLTPTNINNLNNEIKKSNPDGFIETTKSLSGEGKYIGLYSKDWTPLFVQWMDKSNHKLATERQKAGTKNMKEEEKTNYLKTFFTNENNRKVYWEIFGGEGETPTTYEKLKAKPNFE